jgi:hypothetical protein
MEAPNHGRLVGCRGPFADHGASECAELKKAAVGGCLGLRLRALGNRSRSQ